MGIVVGIDHSWLNKDNEIRDFGIKIREVSNRQGVIIEDIL